LVDRGLVTTGFAENTHEQPVGLFVRPTKPDAAGLAGRLLTTLDGRASGMHPRRARPSTLHNAVARSNETVTNLCMGG
jgi:hypothetical protein